MRNVMRHLTALSICCDPPWDYLRDSFVEDVAYLNIALAETKDLCFLSVDLKDFGLDSPSPLKDSYLKAYWSHLKRLDIADATLVPEDLITFADAHKDTLREMNCDSIRMMDEGWEYLGAQLGEILKLERVTLYQVTNDDRIWSASLSNDVHLKTISLLLQWVPSQRRLLKSENGIHAGMVLPEIQQSSLIEPLKKSPT